MTPNYNPFKMGGSYVGALIGSIYSYLALKNFWIDFLDLKLFLSGCQAIDKINFPSAYQECLNYFVGDIHSFIPINYILFIFFGFLLGWGIHSLFRRFSR